MTTHERAVLFLLWNASSTQAAVLAFDVTRANLPRIGRGDRGWLAAACRALGAEPVATAPRVIAARSSYFSDYPADEAPQDRWPDCWMIEAATTGAPAAKQDCGGAPVPLAALDPSWQGARDPAHDARALIVAVGSAGAARETLRGAVASARGDGLRPTSATVRGCTDGRAGIRLLIPCTFSRDVGALESVTGRLQAAGWATNWRLALAA
ncbi:MAG TPA: hypothetical protein VNT54_01865 [Solirubrobacteraceae bacterium]|nr:hypothetical protein [Solirubrobacteraceae bacterium]